MSTVKLYDADSHIFDFTATVLSCMDTQNGFAVILDKTAFFPEGGGQPSDKGKLGDAQVLDVQINHGVITHFADKPLEIGSIVSGKIDALRRFAFMQNHSGEHIVSGIVHSLYGLENVGFHLNEEFATLDFNEVLTDEQLKKVEYIANQKVWQNVAFKTYYPTQDELLKIPYRSKKELDGDIRIVEIEDTDICACCAPHVKTAGEIGIIKIIDTERMRGGIRIVLKCGIYALNDYNMRHQNITDIANRLSVKANETSNAVAALESKLTAEKQTVTALKKRLVERIVQNASENDTVFFEDGLDIKELQLLADALHKKLGGLRVVFSDLDNGFAFAACGDHAQTDNFINNFRKSLPIRGGGRNGMVQGTVTADKCAVLNFFEQK